MNPVDIKSLSFARLSLCSRYLKKYSVVTYLVLRITNIYIYIYVLVLSTCIPSDRNEKFNVIYQLNSGNQSC